MCVFILTCLNFRHLQSTLHLMQYTYGDFYSTAQNSFWTHQFWCLLVLLPFCCFTSSTSAKCSPLRTFSSGGTKTNCSGWDQVNKEGGAWGSCHFWSETAQHSALCKQLHYRVMGKQPWKSLPKILTEAEHRLSQQHQLVHWHRWIPRTLTLKGKPALQGAHPPENNFFVGSPLILLFKSSVSILISVWLFYLLLRVGYENLLLL